MLSNYQAVFFDAGGTLLKVHPSVGHVYAVHARDYGFQGTAEALDLDFRRQWKEMGGIESLGRQSGEAVERKFWKDLVRGVFAAHGGLQNFDQYFDRIFDAFRKKENWRVFADITESDILGKLKSRGVVLGVISNWDSRLPDTLESIGLAKYFDFILCSAVVGSAKPDEKIFQQALEKSGVSPDKACHIGDEVRTDCEGAKKMGIDSILLDRRDRFDQTAFPKVRSLAELV
jgi:putative hydrolase of the HAD superfamily